MHTSRRTALAAGEAGAASLAPGATAQPRDALQDTVAALLRRSEDANDALLRGDVGRYRALVPLTDDFTLMSPMGSFTARGKSYSEEEWAQIGRFFRNGRLTQEVVETYASPDMIVLAVIEHGHGEVGGLPAQDWHLRVTLVYRREGETWKLAHRHADPLARGISVAQSAALAA